MATLHINLEKLITEKLDAKINDAVSKAIEKAFSNISFDFISDQNYDKEENDESLKKEYLMEEDKSKKEYLEEDKGNNFTVVEEKVSEKVNEEDNSTFVELKKGWVERMNAYVDIINQMKSQLTEEQLEQITMPKELVSKKEYSFRLFINNLTWEQLNLLFKNNKYLNIDIVSEDFEIQKIECYGFTPTDIYYKLLRQIITSESNKIYNLNYDNPFDNSNLITSLILNELFFDYRSKITEFIDIVINKHHMEIFDEIFGEQFYMN